jgi:hypothetical protein
MKVEELNTIMESVLFDEIKNRIISESKGGMEKYHVTCEGEPVLTCDSNEEAEEHVDKLSKEHPGKQFIIEKSNYESHADMLEKLDKMGEELEETENNDMKEELIGGQKKLDKNHNGKIDGQDFKILKGQKKETKEELIGGQKKLDKNKNGKIDGEDFKILKGKKQDTKEAEEECDECGSGSYMEEINEGEMCNECGGMMNEEGMCTECSGNMMESKKKTLRLTESELIKLISKMVSEAAIPGMEVYKQAHTASGKENKENLSNVDKKIKGALSIPGATNPEFPKANTKGDKVADNNSKEEDDTVADQRGGTMLDLDYENEPSPEFKDRLKKSLEGDVTMGNSHDAGNVIKSDLGEKLAKVAKRKEEEEKNAPMYNKDAQPVKIVKESKSETEVILENEIKKMKMMYGYDKKTQ